MNRRKHRLPMSAPMIRAIRREIRQPGTGKTQTRRIVKLPLKCRAHGASINSIRHGDEPEIIQYSPYGQPGDLLAFTETFAFGRGYDELTPRTVPADRRIVRVWYRADGEQLSPSVYERCFGRGRWRQTRFMPYWATRYTGVVTDVRIERVQEISEAEARAEGVTGDEPMHGPGAPAESASDVLAARWAFANLWNSLHGIGAWPRNDWVWVYTYRPIAANVLDVERDPEASGLEGAA